MRVALTIVFFVCGCCCGVRGRAQENCSLLTDSSHIRACRLYNAADSFGQGSARSQLYMDSAIRVCPDYAIAWHEISVPYLKRGDFYTWRKYLDRAVELKPMAFLGVRGWCRFKFLHDYEGAMQDLLHFDTLMGFDPGPGGDGTYDLHIVMALCARAVGNYDLALHYFAIGIDSAILRKGAGWMGLHDYLNRAVTKMRVKDYRGALADLVLQEQKYDKYAETGYYRGLIYRAMGRKEEAKASLEAARLLFVTEGTHFSDPYCEMPDQVYPEDIEAALASLSAGEH